MPTNQGNTRQSAGRWEGMVLRRGEKKRSAASLGRSTDTALERGAAVEEDRGKSPVSAGQLLVISAKESAAGRPNSNRRTRNFGKAGLISDRAAPT